MIIGKKRRAVFQSRIMTEAFGELEPGIPLNTFDIAAALNHEKLVAHGTLYYHLRSLVASNQLEIVELPETFIGPNGNQGHVRGYQKPVQNAESA